MENIINCIKDISEELKTRDASLEEIKHALKGEAIAARCPGYEYGQLEDKRYFSKNGERIVRLDRACTIALGCHSVMDWWRTWNGGELSPSGAIVANRKNPNKVRFASFEATGHSSLKSLHHKSDEELVSIAQKNTERYIKAVSEARKIAQEFGFDLSVQDNLILNIIFSKLKERRDTVTKESVEKDMRIAIGKLTRNGDYSKVTELTKLFLEEQYKEVRERLEEIL